MEPNNRPIASEAYERSTISTNTFQIWETTVRLAQIQTLIDKLCLATCPDEAMICFLQETDGQSMLDIISDDEEEDDTEPQLRGKSYLKRMIQDMYTRPQMIGTVKMILYHCLTTMAEKLTQDIKFRSENAEFFDDLELVLSRMTDEAAETTKREIMQYLSIAKKRLAKRRRVRDQQQHQQQQQHHEQQETSSSSSSSSPTPSSSSASSSSSTTPTLDCKVSPPFGS
ncbi:uncharacterized protein LOC128304152 isoform X1 [Anopheles moucheti]|uniref:uncharacterized protein LOC128304152 isoform X1 n=1 Tax=Anopheles moucheti TaxID=186751 RepID=UPI0022F025C9|nr:uncharacterized protein LOC128304152 isoform X1 [Anopheles moucheti]